MDHPDWATAIQKKSHQRIHWWDFCFQEAMNLCLICWPYLLTLFNGLIDRLLSR